MCIESREFVERSINFLVRIGFLETGGQLIHGQGWSDLVSRVGQSDRKAAGQILVRGQLDLVIYKLQRK